jgi:hypothetical protein
MLKNNRMPFVCGLSCYFVQIERLHSNGKNMSVQKTRVKEINFKEAAVVLTM